MKFLLTLLLFPLACNKHQASPLPPVSEYTCGSYDMDGWYSMDADLEVSYAVGQPPLRDRVLGASLSVASTGCSVTFVGFGWLPYENRIVVDSFASHVEAGVELTKEVEGECSLEDVCWFDMTQRMILSGDEIGRVVSRADLSNIRLLPQAGD